MATLEEYLGLITSFHRGKPKFTATVSALVQPLVDLQNVLANFPTDFDLDVAVGNQLDIGGIWVGRTRFVPVPIPNVWFTLDDASRGFDAGYWQGPYDTGAGIVRLDDETYRTYLRGKIAANQWDGTIETAATAYDFIFSAYPNSLLFILDDQDMSMTVGIAGALPPLIILALLEQGFLPLKPEGVRINYAITSVVGSSVFGFDVENDRIAGFDTGAWGVGPNYYLNA